MLSCCRAPANPSSFLAPDPAPEASASSSDPMHLTVRTTDAVPGVCTGSIECHASGATSYEWFRDGAPARLALDDAGTHAADVEPGVYEIVARAPTGATVRAQTTVQTVDIPCIDGYDVTHASNDAARDGSIVVRGRNLDRCEFLWTNGVFTTGPVLHDVRPGTYVATPLRDRLGVATHVHASAPAIVLMSRHPNQI